MTDWNTRIIAEFRANSGHVAWSTANDFAAGRPVPPQLPTFGDRDLPILLLHHTGARTGRDRITPLLYQPVGAGYAVFATFGGSGYRRYGTDVVPLVANLRRLLDAGLSVADIQRFEPCLAEPAMSASPCAPALDVYEQRLATLDDLIATLTHRRSRLAAQTEQRRATLRKSG